MIKYKEVREVVNSILDDQQWHTIDELQSKCEENGMSFEKGRGPIYNVTHQLKKQGKIETDGGGKYRAYRKNELVQRNSKEYIDSLVKEIEVYLAKYKRFDWVRCSDEELQEARNNAMQLIGLARKIENTFEEMK